MSDTYTDTIEARHLPAALRDPSTVTYLTAVEGAPLAAAPGQNTLDATGMLIEQAVELPADDEAFPDGAIQLSVWHGAAWMFGIVLSLDDRVTIETVGWTRPQFPAPPSREGLDRVHGTWYSRENHPFQSVREGR